MTQESRKLINLAVHESSDPSEISPNSDLEDSGENRENVDVPTPDAADIGKEENIVNKQITIANLSAG
ncbi:MAG: hypothetical protein KME23_02875 [Goleter apudmare HA4340-LM2]|jgi:hypothetical protein|nr:hypothetical protein [Goleter apudmare HA4340-LM2]